MRLKALMACAATAVALLPVPARAAVKHDRVVSANPADRTPHVLDGAVRAIVQVGDTIVAGGIFTEVREAGSGARLRRSNLFAFDATTGEIRRRFDPVVDGPVFALETDGSAIYAGGRFGTVDGIARKKVVKLSLRGRVIRDFTANVSGPVHDMALRGRRLFLAGVFGTVNGVERSALAAVATKTGRVLASPDVVFADPRQATRGIEKIDVTADGSTLIAIGNFTTVDGLPRSQIAVLDVGSRPATVTDWRTDSYPVEHCHLRVNTYMRDVALAPNGRWFVVVTTGGSRPGQLCDSAARWQLGGGGQHDPTWVNHTGGDTLWSVAITGPVVYVGGHQRWHNNPYGRDEPGPGAVPRAGIAALDPANGLPLRWNPGRARGQGAFALLPTRAGLWVGSDTERLGGETHARIGMFPLAGGKRVAKARIGRIPGQLYAIEQAGRLVKRSFDGTTLGPRRIVDRSSWWTDVRGAFMLGKRLFAGWDDGAVRVRRFDGADLGRARSVNLRGMNAQIFPVADLTGMFFAGRRVYYTVAGDPVMHMRYFTPDGNVFGACPLVNDTRGHCIEDFDVSGPGIDGRDWSDVQGLTMASGRIYVVRDGTLHGLAFSGGRPSGAEQPISGPAIDGQDWASRGLFVLPRR